MAKRKVHDNPNKMRKGGKFLKKLWFCVDGEYYKIIWFYQLGRVVRKLVNVYPGLKVNCSIIFSC